MDIKRIVCCADLPEMAVLGMRVNASPDVGKVRKAGWGMDGG